MKADVRSEPPKPLVLIIEDDPQVRKFLRASLNAHGYRVEETASGLEGVSMVGQFTPDLVLLDLGLPDIDGIDVARRIREWSTVPIIVLSARGQEDQKVIALDAGTDDYLTKPFGVPELLARMRVAFRHAARASNSPDKVFVSGPLKVDLAARRVTLSDSEVHLTPIEYKILTSLVKHAGHVVTQRHLLEEVWGPQSAHQSQYLRVYMTHLRRKLEPDPVRPRLFLTEAGVGYRLVVDES
jgi:two-component system KDP operon response regulator KdpE